MVAMTSEAIATDHGAVADFHEPEQRCALGDEQPGERADREPDAGYCGENRHGPRATVSASSGQSSWHG